VRQIAASANPAIRIYRAWFPRSRT
jgi:hypothetical protein